MGYPEWEESEEHEDWIQSGGRDSDFEYYYDKWERQYRKHLPGFS